MNKEASELVLNRLNLPSKNFDSLLYYNDCYSLKSLFTNCELIHEFTAGGGDETSQYALWKLNKFGEAKVDMYLSYGQVIGSCNYCSCNKNSSLLQQIKDNIWRSCLSDSLETTAKDYLAKIRGYWDIEQWEINEVQKELESAHDLDLKDPPMFHVYKL